MEVRGDDTTPAEQVRDAASSGVPPERVDERSWRRRLEASPEDERLVAGGVDERLSRDRKRDVDPGLGKEEVVDGAEPERRQRERVALEFVHLADADRDATVAGLEAVPLANAGVEPVPPLADFALEQPGHGSSPPAVSNRLRSTVFGCIARSGILWYR